MSGPIQLAPPGLLGFLQLKVGGQNPRELNESIAPTFEMWRHMLDAYATFDGIDWYYQLPAAAEYRGTIVPLNGGAGAALEVPSHEYWWVKAFTLNSAALAKATNCIQMKPVVLHAPYGAGTGYELLNEGNGAQVSSAYAQPITTQIWTAGAYGFLAPPGARLAAFVNAIVSAATPITARVCYSRLPV